MIGIDSSALIDLWKKKEPIIELLKDIDEEIILNQISYLELMFGLDFTILKHKEEELFYDEIFDNYNIFGLNKKASKKTSEIFWELKKKGEGVDEFDCMIAGIYLSNGINKIITKDAEHFNRIKGMTVMSY